MREKIINRNLKMKKISQRVLKKRVKMLRLKRRKPKKSPQDREFTIIGNTKF